MKTPQFIQSSYLSQEAVNECCDLYEKYQNLVEPGKILSGVNASVKDSQDLSMPPENFCKESQVYISELHQSIRDYVETYPMLNEKMDKWGIVDEVLIQYYKPGGGYKVEHFERSGLGTSHRLLVYMTYLTNTPNAGTHFPLQNWTSSCEKGLTLIWPADWMYTHVGVINEKKDKMIITGWTGFLDEWDSPIGNNWTGFQT